MQGNSLKNSINWLVTECSSSLPAPPSPPTTTSKLCYQILWVFSSIFFNFLIKKNGSLFGLWLWRLGSSISVFWNNKLGLLVFSFPILDIIYWCLKRLGEDLALLKPSPYCLYRNITTLVNSVFTLGSRKYVLVVRKSALYTPHPFFLLVIIVLSPICLIFYEPIPNSSHILQWILSTIFYVVKQKEILVLYLSRYLPVVASFPASCTHQEPVQAAALEVPLLLSLLLLPGSSPLLPSFRGTLSAAYWERQHGSKEANTCSLPCLEISPFYSHTGW